MAVRIESRQPSPAERAAVDSLLGRDDAPAHAPERGVASALGVLREGAGAGHVAWGGHASRERRHLLLPVLHAIQSRVGWLSKGALDYVARRLELPPADIFGVASFYHWFSLEERPPVIAHVCDDVSCKV